MEQNLVVENFVDSHCTGSCDIAFSGDNRVGLIEAYDYDSIELVRNTFSKNEFRDHNDNDVHNFIMRTDRPWVAIGNIFHDNRVENFMDRDTDYDGGSGTLTDAICNVSAYLALLANAENAVANVREDPMFSDPDSGNFSLQSSSPAINRCDDVVGPDSYDIAGRLTPREDFPSQSGLNGFHDSGPLEYQLFGADEVDLRVNLAQLDSDDIQGQLFEVTLSNIGMTAALSANFSLRFLDVPGITQQDLSWTCEPFAGQASCTYDLANQLAPQAMTAPLVLRVPPDFEGNCELSVFSDSGMQPDTESGNNSAASANAGCGLGELVFRNSFETGVQP